MVIRLAPWWTGQTGWTSFLTQGVPREVRTIKDRITQRRHKDFIDVFERELAGGTP